MPSTIYLMLSAQKARLEARTTAMQPSSAGFGKSFTSSHKNSGAQARRCIGVAWPSLPAIEVNVGGGESEAAPTFCDQMTAPSVGYSP